MLRAPSAKRATSSDEKFAAYWPSPNTEENAIGASLNTAKKYVASRPLQKLAWSNSTLLRGDVAKGRRSTPLGNKTGLSYKFTGA